MTAGPSVVVVDVWGLGTHIFDQKIQLTGPKNLSEAKALYQALQALYIVYTVRGVVNEERSYQGPKV